MTEASRSPVTVIPTDRLGRGPEEGIALCLSGGGYRAMLFHLGALWRLNEGGFLPRLARISSVSGGSIVAGLMGLRWGALAFDGRGVATRFTTEVVKPIRALADRTIDVPAILTGLVLPGGAGRRIATRYRRLLFGQGTLQDLPDSPRFVINATSVQSGVLWRFMKPYMRDYRVGEVRAPQIPLALAVAASSAFPPFLSPVRLRLREADFTPASGMDLQVPPFTTRVVLTDGGVYDNLGLETAWKRYRTVLVSDGGRGMQSEPRPWRLWPLHAYRVLEVIDNQVRALRKQQAVGSLASGERRGTYWGIGTDVADYKVADPLPAPREAVERLAAVATRLRRLPASTQEQLINWGYAVCDAALRRYVDPALPRPAGFPYSGGIG